jgi:hypothetical protein
MRSRFFHRGVEVGQFAGAGLAWNYHQDEPEDCETRKADQHVCFTGL